MDKEGKVNQMTFNTRFSSYESFRDLVARCLEDSNENDVDDDDDVSDAFLYDGDDSATNLATSSMTSMISAMAGGIGVLVDYILDDVPSYSEPELNRSIRTLYNRFVSDDAIEKRYAFLDIRPVTRARLIERLIALIRNERPGNPPAPEEAGEILRHIIEYDPHPGVIARMKSQLLQDQSRNNAALQSLLRTMPSDLTDAVQVNISGLLPRRIVAYESDSSVNQNSEGTFPVQRNFSYVVEQELEYILVYEPTDSQDEMSVGIEISDIQTGAIFPSPVWKRPLLRPDGIRRECFWVKSELNIPEDVDDVTVDILLKVSVSRNVR
jgi:hypothetical protein